MVQVFVNETWLDSSYELCYCCHWGESFQREAVLFSVLNWRGVWSVVVMSTDDCDTAPFPRHVDVDDEVVSGEELNWKSPSDWETSFDEYYPVSSSSFGGGSPPFTPISSTTTTARRITTEEPWQGSVYSVERKPRKRSSKQRPPLGRSPIPNTSNATEPQETLFSPPEPIQSPPAMDPRSELSKYKETLRRQEMKMQSLERENQTLRRRLATDSSSTIDTGSEGRGGNHPSRNSSNGHNNHNNIRRTGSGGSSSNGGAYSYRERYHSHSFSSPGSFGVRFVAEYAELVDLDVGHHGLLASIMDRYGSTRRRLSRPHH